MTSTPVDGAPAPDQAARTAPAGQDQDRDRGSPIPTLAMISARAMELRRRRGLMAAIIAANVGLPALFLGIRLILHAFAPRTNPPAGGGDIFAVLAAGFMPTFAFILAATAGCTAGSRDLTEGMFRHLVVTGRSRVSLYLARIPAGLAIVTTIVAIGYTLVCAVCVFAAPAFVNDWNAIITPGLSQAGFENWAAHHADVVICDLPYNGKLPADVPCPPEPKSSLTPGRPAPKALVALAVKVARQDYSGYTSIVRRPSISLMVTAGLWIELQSAVGFTIGLGLASLMGQRTGPVILMIVFQLIVTPILAAPGLLHVPDLQRLFVGLAMARLEPSGLPIAAALPGVTGGVGGPGAADSMLPESAAQASWVIIAWLAGWTILGAWRMRTREA